MAELGSREYDDLLNIQLGQKKKRARDKDLLDKADNEFTKQKYTPGKHDGKGNDKKRDGNRDHNLKKDNKTDQNKDRNKKDKEIVSNVLHQGHTSIKNDNKMSSDVSPLDKLNVTDFCDVNNLMQSMNNQIDSQIEETKYSKNVDQNIQDVVTHFNIADKSHTPTIDKPGLIADPNFQTNFPQLEEIDDFVEDIKTRVEEDIDQDWLITFLDESNKKGLQTAKRT